MIRWEYKRATFEIAMIAKGDFDEKLNALGSEGWELTTTTERERHGHTHEVHFVFRRPIEG
jgi:hypothetical protein